MSSGILTSSHEAPRDRAAVSTLERSILEAVAYADVFDYPLTADEIHRYLIGATASPAAVTRALGGSRILADVLSQHDQFYALRGRESVVETRRLRTQHAAGYWQQAIRYGRLLGGLPFVRMVAVTGALAMDNVADDDIDYLVITEPGRLWLCRALVVGLVRAAALRGCTLCPNYFLTERALELDERNLFTAHEVTQMVPLGGFAVYNRLRHLNQWTATYLPNASGPPRRVPRFEPRHQRVRDLSERVLRSRWGGQLEGWEMRRKLHKFSPRAAGHVEAAFSPDWCKGHFGDHGQLTLSRYQQRLQALAEQLG